MSLGNRIRDARRAMHLSQDELAIGLGLTQGAVSQWELDKTTPDVEALVPLAKFLGVSLDWLLELDEADITSQAKVNGMELVSRLSAALASDRLTTGQVQVISDLLRQFLSINRSESTTANNV